MKVRLQVLIFAIASLCLTGLSLAQSNEQEGPVPVQRVPVDSSAPKPKDNRKSPPRSDQLAPDESSSKQTEIDVAPPKGDEKHPGVSDEELGEFHPFDPHKAAKCIEVGDYYLKQGNTRAAISRYQEALDWKPHDAEATYKLGEAQEKSGELAAALANYQAYLKVLPAGPFAAKAQQGITRLKAKVDVAAPPPAPKPS
ncbi:MAG TPA: tetratricopeptide repeat protein [Candidatus Bathyarchaeia archaeon]|nr:tetratricopeptide repeat protein [Candidatus Bathyarchaeia archaeon]